MLAAIIWKSRSCSGDLSEFDSPNNSISTLAELLCDHISLINDEVLIENLEGLPSLE